MSVASFTDAWIETENCAAKLPIGVVASFTDAWIETLKKQIEALEKMSHLLQMRGLKLSG